MCIQFVSPPDIRKTLAEFQLGDLIQMTPAAPIGMVVSGVPEGPGPKMNVYFFKQRYLGGYSRNTLWLYVGRLEVDE